jgi:hypothetical protein
MNNPLLVFENIHTAQRHPLFTLLGTPWKVTPLGWLVLPAYFTPGLLVAFLLPTTTSTSVRVVAGIMAGVAIILTTALHEIGHILSARWVGAPVDELCIAAVRPLTLYEDKHEPSRRVHLGRALGGPVINLFLALLAGAVWQMIASDLPQPYVTGLGAFFLANLLYGLGAFMPLPSVDGEVIWRELLQH